MIVIIPFYQKENKTNSKGEVLPKGNYVDYGIDMNTLETICLPYEDFNLFVSKNCIKINNEYVLKE